MVTEFHAAAAAGRPVLEVEGVSSEVFGELLDTVRGVHPEQPLRPSPLATPQAARAAFAVGGVDYDNLPDPTELFEWRWLRLDIASPTGRWRMVLPVAVLRNAINAYTSN